VKRASNSYRLQLIKEVATRRQQQLSHDPMADYIHQLLEDRPQFEHHSEQHRFAGNHFDEHAGGWVSDKWGLK